jgi:hypothetical protein
MQKEIEQVCNFQIEFWTHLTTVIPDLNVLDAYGKKINSSASEAEVFWHKLCKINPNYYQALQLYGEYLTKIRNNNKRGGELLEKAASFVTLKKSIEENVNQSDSIFSEDTCVIHVSGNKNTAGKILKTNQSLTKVFGYNKGEVLGHSVNILMPSIFAKRHSEFMEKFFKTGL